MTDGVKRQLKGNQEVVTQTQNVLLLDEWYLLSSIHAHVHNHARTDTHIHHTPMYTHTPNYTLFF